jgi:hypothetical protein
MKESYINVFYSAAAVSVRLENLNCPAFNHRFIIKDIDLKESDSNESLVISSLSQRRIQRAIDPLGYGRTIYNAGVDLVGEYRLEIALLDSKNKTILSNFVPIGPIARVENELISGIKGCENATVPAPGSKRKDFIDNFKFGR